MSSLFSFEGRIGRGSWWLVVLLILVVVGILYGIVYAMQGDGDPNVALVILLVVVYAVAIWINAAATVKRYHDRNKSGAWFFIALVPFIGGLWQLIECGFLSGTPGPNQYGDEP